MLTRCLCQKPSFAGTSLVRVFDTNREFKIYDATATTQILHRECTKRKALHALNVLVFISVHFFPVPGKSAT